MPDEWEVPEFLDTSRFPRSRIITGVKSPYDGSVSDVDLGDVISNFKSGVQMMQASGLIKPTESIGFVMTNPYPFTNSPPMIWDSPYRLIWFAGGWGDPEEVEGLVANAACKARPLGRNSVEATSTLDIARLRRELFDPEADCVENAVGQKRPRWGDFAHPGAVQLQMGPLSAIFAVSGAKGDEDHLLALMLGAGCFIPILRVPLPSSL